MKSKAKHSKKHTIFYILIILVAIFGALLILGTLIPQVNVTNVQLIINSSSYKNITELAGFHSGN